MLGFVLISRVHRASLYPILLQLEGLNWMINLHDNEISGILADEMGESI